MAGAALAMALFGVTACGGSAEDEGSAEPTTTESAPAGAATDAPEAPEALEPDLESIPDVVAVVNGEEITKDEFVAVYEVSFAQMAQQAQMTGQPVDEPTLKTQTAEGMVDTELLLQEAANRGLDVSDEEITATLEELALAYGLESADAFVGSMVESGMTEDEVMTQVDIQARIEKLIADEAGDTTPTDEEIQTTYDGVIAQQEAAGAASGQSAPPVPPLEEVRPQVEEQVRAEKENAAITALLAELRESGDITVTVS